MKIKKFDDFNESQGTSLNQWELRKLINKKAKIKKIGKENVENATVNNVT